MMKEIFLSAIFAGIAIGVGGCVFLNVGGPVGAALFAFGLLTVVHYKLKLYTGTAGFIFPGQWRQLLLILLGNIVGCLLIASLLRYCTPDLVDKATAVMERRMQMGPVVCGLMGIGCGLIMTTAVRFAREGRMLPLLFGVPVFILCGFTHCIADAFYYCLASPQALAEHAVDIAMVYPATVLGNLAGCNLYRAFIKDVA